MCDLELRPHLSSNEKTLGDHIIFCGGNEFVALEIRWCDNLICFDESIIVLFGMYVAAIVGTYLKLMPQHVKPILASVTLTVEFRTFKRKLKREA